MAVGHGVLGPGFGHSKCASSRSPSYGRVQFESLSQGHRQGAGKKKSSGI